MIRLFAEVDKLKGTAEAESELRQLNSERFTRIDEEIGELRNMLVDREKDISSLEVKATKAADLVSEVQPEALMAEVKKFDVKMESLKGKLESYHELNDTILEELKEIRRIVKTFRGVDEVRKMLADAHKDLTSYEKIEGKMENTADKIEEIYDDFLKKFDSIKEFEDTVTELKGKFGDYEQEFNKIKESTQETIKKSEFNDFSSKMHSFIQDLEGRMDEFNLSVQFMNDIKGLVNSLEDEMGSILTELSDNKRALSKLTEDHDATKALDRSRLSEIDIAITELYTKINDNDQIDSLQSRLNDIETKIELVNQGLIESTDNQQVDFMAEERILAAEKAVEELTKKMESMNEALSIVSDNGAAEKIMELDSKLKASEEREKKIIQSVSTIIDLVEKLQ